jgi:hypothetical protein
MLQIYKFIVLVLVKHIEMTNEVKIQDGPRQLGSNTVEHSLTPTTTYLSIVVN